MTTLFVPVVCALLLERARVLVREGARHWCIGVDRVSGLESYVSDDKDAFDE